MKQAQTEIASRPKQLGPEQRRRLYRQHVQGAYVRIGASLFMWLYAFMAHKLGVIQTQYIVAVTICVIYLIAINPPLLWLLRQIQNRSKYEWMSIFINFSEIIGYTAIIYSMGGINALYLSPIYAALIAYVGAVSPPRVPFIIASLSAGTLISMAALQYFHVIPPMEAFWKVQLPRSNQIVVAMATICLLYVVAFIISYTAGLLRKNRLKLRDQNRALEASRLEIEESAALLERKNIELEAAVERAQESEALKSEFLANMSHDLRTPLNHIMGFTEMVLNPKFGELNAVQKEYLNDVHFSSQHLLALINDILDFSKIEAGKLDFSFSTVDVRGLVDSCVSMVSETARGKGLELSCSSEGAPGEIIADEIRLRQVLYNLLSNAVKFTPPEGRISIDVEPVAGILQPSGDIEQVAADPYVKFSVSDTGVGLREQDIDKVFNSFEQVNNPVSRRDEGTGLGLAIAKKLIEMHHGEIWVDSPGENMGSTFTFVIPAAHRPDRQTSP